MWCNGVELGDLAQLLDLAANAFTYRLVWFEERLLASEQIAALSGLGVDQVSHQAFNAINYHGGMLACHGGLRGLAEGPEQGGHRQRDEQENSREGGHNVTEGFARLSHLGEL